MRDYGMTVDIVDTWADPAEVQEEYGCDIGTALPESGHYDAVILAVPHDDLVAQAEHLRGLLKPNGLLFDMKAALPATQSDLRL